MSDGLPIIRILINTVLGVIRFLIILQTYHSRFKIILNRATKYGWDADFSGIQFSDVWSDESILDSSKLITEMN